MSFILVYNCYSQVQYTGHLVFHTWKCELLRTKKVYPHRASQQLKIEALVWSQTDWDSDPSVASYLAA